jgi:hypothetical protein
MTIMWYLYAIADADDANGIGALSGIDDSPVKTLTAGDLAAIAGEVDTAGFEAARMHADLREDGWLAQAVRAHDRVIWQAFTRSAVLLPSRFGALFTGHDDLTGWLKAESPRLRRALDLVRDAAEWDIEVQIASDVDGNEVADLSGHEQASLVYETVHNALAACAIGAHDGFYLVRRDGEGAFTGKVHELVGLFPGTQIKMTGPQPAYHFVDARRERR